MDNGDSDVSCAPPDLHELEAAKEITLVTLPEKSKLRYEKQYDMFLNWCNEKELKEPSEDVVLAYFHEKSKTSKSSTMWAIFSMLKATILTKRDIDIGQYKKLLAFLKKQAIGYRANKSAVFSRGEVNKFLIEAPNQKYLLMKVVLIIGIAGACHRDELTRMTIHDIQDKDSLLIITIPESKTRKKRIFTVSDEKEVKYLELVRQYLMLRPQNISTSRFFLQYDRGLNKCSTQVVGMNSFGKIPSSIAEYLHLPNPKQYTGHCFKRTSAMLVDINKTTVDTMYEQILQFSPESSHQINLLRSLNNYEMNNCESIPQYNKLTSSPQSLTLHSPVSESPHSSSNQQTYQGYSINEIDYQITPHCSKSEPDMNEPDMNPETNLWISTSESSEDDDDILDRNLSKEVYMKLYLKYKRKAKKYRRDNSKLMKIIINRAENHNSKPDETVEFKTTFLQETLHNIKEEI